MTGRLMRSSTLQALGITISFLELQWLSLTNLSIAWVRVGLELK